MWCIFSALFMGVPISFPTGVNMKHTHTCTHTVLPLFFFPPCFFLTSLFWGERENREREKRGVGGVWVGVGGCVCALKEAEGRKNVHVHA
jgi:hypothetical protein